MSDSLTGQKPKNTYTWLLHLGGTGPLTTTQRSVHLGDGTELPISLSSEGFFVNGQPVFAGSVSWSSVSGKPSTFPPSLHTHDASEVTAGVFNSSRLGTGAAVSGTYLSPSGWQSVGFTEISGKPLYFPSAPSALDAEGAVEGDVMAFDGSSWGPFSAVTLLSGQDIGPNSVTSNAGDFQDVTIHMSLTLSNPLTLANGGTGADNETQARINLGLGSLATLNSVSLLTQVTGLLPLANGGTGAANAAAARANLGAQAILVSGSNIRTINGASLLGSGDLSVARAIETRTANFSAVLGGRYIVESAGTVSITDPSGTAAGDSYEVWIGSGSVQFGGAGTVYSASRFSIRRRFTGTSWVTPAPSLADTLTVGSGTWTGNTFTGPQTFTGQMEASGQALATANSLVNRGLADARYAPISLAGRSTSQVDATTTTMADVPGLTGFVLEANTWYRVEFAGMVNTTTGASWSVELNTTQNLARTSGLLPSVGNAGNTAVVQAFFQTATRVVLIQRSTTNTGVPNFQTVIFKTGASAPTCKVQFAQWSSPAGTASLLSDAVLVITRLPVP